MKHKFIASKEGDMLKKIFFFLFIIIPINAYSSSLWEGKWEVGRYDNAFGGVLIIKNCQDKICDFDIKTYNGAHVCGGILLRHKKE